MRWWRWQQMKILASVMAERKKRRAWTLETDHTLQQLVADLVAARRATGATQDEAAARMWTTKSVVSRLESGRCTRPTLSTIEKYADAVGALVEIRVRIGRSLPARALKPDARSNVCIGPKATIRGREAAAGRKRLVDAQAFHHLSNFLERDAGATRRGVA